MTDYKDTVFLPQTAFPMRGGLPKKEPEILALWARLGLYQRLRAQAAASGKFVLHDGPPYANGNIHIGHAVNKILKDAVNRCAQMLGYDAPYVPGWDCHGLPIEWKIEEKYRAAGKDKDAVPILDFRAECRAFARHWQEVQGAEFQRLGVVGDWDNPYSTMDFLSEAGIVREIHAFASNGGLYRGVKSVMWSPVEKTALAEAEVEYHDITSTTVYVKFPIVKTGMPELQGASVVAWTTTPWTLPSNRALACGTFSYSVVESAAGKLVLASGLVAAFAKATGIELKETARIPGAALPGTVCAHPLRGRGYDYDVPLLAGDFVTTEAGTGFVHIAPSHGEDDYQLGLKHKIEMPDNVDDEGRFRPHVPLFAGRLIYRPNGKEGDANRAVTGALKEAGALLGEQKITHSYPHSWRSKAPVIFRATPQWFVSMEANGLRAAALEAIGKTRWVPPQGEHRIRAMIEQRPDWCVSRQRAWGVPIAIFVEKKTGEILRDSEVFTRIALAFEKEGADAWFARPAQEFLGNGYKAADYEQVFDIVDVWFESGSTHGFVLERRGELRRPADLYLEGSDQHRGWFHSSLLESCGTRGEAPFEAVLTHGFVLDEKGNKMSKSAGNTVAPQKVIEQMGADILRLWVLGADYTEDLRVGPEILKQTSETYRRLRNTLRYLLGALAGFGEEEKIPPRDMPELERWVLHRLFELDGVARACIRDFNFTRLTGELHHFCAVDLSAFYFDIRKDSLYCDARRSPRRRAARTAMNAVFEKLVLWLAPLLCFTAEEAWQVRRAEGGNGAESVHLELFHGIPEDWRDAALAGKWAGLRRLRAVVTGALEIARHDGKIGSGLQAAPVLYVDAGQAKLLEGADFAEICITSSLRVEETPPPAGAFTLADVPGAGVVVDEAPGHKCARCWRVLPEVGQSAAHPALCRRCEDVVG